jgi:TPR repeat protein
MMNLYIRTLVLATLLLPLIVMAQDAAQADYEAGFAAYREEDLITAMQLLEKSALAGHAQAQVLLGYIQDRAEANEEAVRWYQMALDQGEPEAMLRLGLLYRNGEGVETDVDRGNELIIQAAESGLPEAMFSLAKQLENDEPIDLAEAVRWYQLAADAGQSNSRERLRRAYSLGELGLTIDADLAARYGSEPDSEGESESEQNP